MPLCLALIGALPAANAHTTADSAWHGLADRVFRQVAANADLPNAQITTAIIEGPDGLIWLGSNSGLTRWDGYDFHDYAAEPAKPDGLRGTDVSVLHRDPNRNLWAGGFSGWLARYDQAQERLVNVKLSPRCAGKHIWSMADDSQGGLLVGCRGGLVRLDAAGNEITSGPRMPGQPGQVEDDDTFTLLRDHAGVLWVGTRHGVVRSTDDGHGFAPFPGLVSDTMGTATMLEDSAHRIWVGTVHHGAFVIGADRGPAQAIAATASANPEAPEITINALLEIAPGLMWIGTDGHGIVEVDGATLHSQTIMHDPLVPGGLTGNSIQALYRDRSGLVWISTNAGLSTYNGSAGIMTLFSDPDRHGGLPSESVLSLLSAPDGSLWTGLAGGGFVVLDPHGRRAAGLAGNGIWSMAPLPGGGVLMSTDHGLVRVDAAGRVVGPVKVPELGESASVTVLTTIGDTIWIGSTVHGTLSMQLDASGHARNVRNVTSGKLTSEIAQAFAQAPDGRIAIGSFAAVSLLNPATGAIERITPNAMDPHGLLPGGVTAFATDPRGRLWVGTASGLNVMTGRDGAGHPQFRHLLVADGLPNASIDSLLPDRQGRMWAATDRGIAVIDMNTLAVRALQRADGLAITNYWSGSIAGLPGGEIALGGMGGLTILQPDKLMPWSYRPPVSITALRVGGQLIMGQHLPGSVVTVPPNANSLSVEFAALDFSEPAQNRYAYRLEGFDPAWIDTDGRHRIADYTNLPPGNYVLHVRGSNRDGIWSEPEATLNVRVLPAWYQTLWFSAAVTAACILLALAILQRWTEVLRSRQRTLERQVATRTLELSDSKQQLQLANADLEKRVLERTAALQASEARFRAWFDNAEDAMFVVQVHPDGSFSYEALNGAVARIFGIDPVAGQGRTPEQLLPPTYATNEMARYRVATLGEPVHYESTVPSGRGERLIDTWLVPLRNAATGRVERLVGAARDLTERRALEARLAQAQKLQALGALAGGIAHDFNNILQAVAGTAMLMERRPDDPEKILRLARSTQAAAERGTSITRRLLAFARSDTLSVEAIPTLEVLAGIADVLSFTLGSEITVATDFPADLPPLLADRGQLETALVNLGTNGRDAMPQGGTLSLSARAETVGTATDHPSGLPPGNYVRIKVKDAGSGMDAATLARAIEPFFTTKPQGQGTGLGLAQVKGFAEQSGGQMTITSKQGAGTTVCLWLRVANTQTSQATDKTQGTPHRRGRETILLVDDDQLVRETLAEQLQDAGFTVLAAEGGAQALALLHGGAWPDVMLCDLSMPGMDGAQTIRAARALRPDMRCFLLTGYAGERAGLDRTEGFTLLRKPIRASALIAQIEARVEAVGE